MIKPDYKIEVIQHIHRQAFGDEEGPVIADLVQKFMALKSTISITTEREGQKVGNVIFTPLMIDGHPNRYCFLLCPLAVLPAFQRQGVGKELIEKGAAHLTSIGADAMFVLGDPNYYARHGFGLTNIQPPYSELVTMKEAWRMRELGPNTLPGIRASSTAVEPIMDPAYWDTSGHTE